jgi:hypothetical protein
MSNNRFPCNKIDIPEFIFLDGEGSQTTEGNIFLTNVKNMLEQAHFFIDSFPVNVKLDWNCNSLIKFTKELGERLHYIENPPKDAFLHNYDSFVVEFIRVAIKVNELLCDDLQENYFYEQAAIGMKLQLDAAESRVEKALPDYQAVVNQIAGSLQNTSRYHDARDLLDFKLALRISSILDSLQAPPNEQVIFGRGLAAGAGGTLLLSTVLLLALRTPTAKYLGGKLFSFASTVTRRLCLFVVPSVGEATDEEQMGLRSDPEVELSALKLT